jgi:hypothetical protein
MLEWPSWRSGFIRFAPPCSTPRPWRGLFNQLVRLPLPPRLGSPTCSTAILIADSGASGRNPATSRQPSTNTWTPPANIGGDESTGTRGRSSGSGPTPVIGFRGSRGGTRGGRASRLNGYACLCRRLTACRVLRLIRSSGPPAVEPVTTSLKATLTIQTQHRG